MALLVIACLQMTAPLQAASIEFDIPAQPAADALLQFSRQAHCNVLFSYDDLSRVASSRIAGHYEPTVALELLLRDTGFSAHRNGTDRFIVTPTRIQSGTITGRIDNSEGTALGDVRIVLPDAHLSTLTDRDGKFTLRSVPPGIYSMQATKAGYQGLRWEHLQVRPHSVLELAPQTLKPFSEPIRLEPFMVVDASDQHLTTDWQAAIPRTVIGDLDLPRSENDPLPYRVFERSNIDRSGVINLNEFLRRELLDSDATTLPPEQNSSMAGFLAGSSNLNLRGFGSDATIILVNGRRLPESAATTNGMLGAPDVNSIPLSLVQRIEVLPASAAAQYNGNPVGGVINIVLRPDINGTELRTIYTNALSGYDAPQSSIALLHGQNLLHGKLRLRFSANFTRTVPPTEAELGYYRANDRSSFTTGDNIHRATPNIRSADGQPLFGPGTSSYTSVAPGSDGTGGLAAFSGRYGVHNLALFNSSGGFAASPDSIDNPYGRRQHRASYALSATYDPWPWLQIGMDTLYTHTRVNRGYDVFTGDLNLTSTSPFNPFGHDVVVSLNETAPRLGEGYSEARLDFLSSLMGVLVRLPAGWQASLDAQVSRNTVDYRGLAGVNQNRWQQLVDSGLYNPLRDTQAYAPPSAFYDQALIYYGRPNQFVRLGDYTTLDAAVRLANDSIPLPSGIASSNFGFDYRRTELRNHTQRLEYADGTPATEPIFWKGRTLERLSFFTEFQAPILPVNWRPSWLRNLEADIAVRYITAATSNETNLAPTLGFKADFSGGWALRGSSTFSNRYPTPAMSHRVSLGAVGGPSVSYASVYDPRRDQTYTIVTNEDPNPDLKPEGSVTQSFGVMFHRGRVHRFRASLDFIDTRKENEMLYLGAQTLLNLESLWPERVERAPLGIGDAHSVGKVTAVLTGTINSSWRHSQNWNTSLDYTWNECLGGRLEAYARMIYFARYDRRILPTTSIVNELEAPDDTVSGLMRYRANGGVSWTGSRFGGGIDLRYYHARRLPEVEWASQGADHISAYWQCDAYLQSDLTRWLPWKTAHGGLTAQLRVNDILDTRFPHYANDASGAGVQAYGDWRGRTYSLSLNATF